MAAPEKFWVVWLVDTSRTGREQPYSIQAAPSKAAAERIVTSAGNVILSTDGPFGTRAAALDDVKDKTKRGAVAVSANPPITAVTGGGFGIKNPLGAIAHWLGDIVLHLADGAMWRSLGWMALGAAMIWLGLLMWLKLPQKAAQVAPAIAAAPI